MHLASRQGGEGMKKTAILIMDVQKDFVGESARMPVAKHQIEPMLDAINSVIQTPSEHTEVIYIVNHFEKSSWISNFFRRYAAMKGTEGAQLDDRLLVVNEQIFVKKVSDAFSNPDMERFLTDKQVDEIVFTGLYAEGCVYYTACSAIKRGYRVTLLKDAIVGANDAKREKALRKLEKQGATTATAQEFRKRFA